MLRDPLGLDKRNRAQMGESCPAYHWLEVFNDELANHYKDVTKDHRRNHGR
jgi:hypothetical protein